LAATGERGSEWSIIGEELPEVASVAEENQVNSFCLAEQYSD
jgi:hypothetical protein